MAAYKAIKIQTGEHAGKYGVSRKQNTYLPSKGVYDTRQMAVYKAELLNVVYYEQLSWDAWDKAVKAARNSGIETDEYGFEIKSDCGDYMFERGDVIC